MRWIKVSAAFLVLSAVATQANAGLFDCFHTQPTCCAPEPTCCHVEPTCCAPTPVACHVAPTCCTPAPQACHVAPTCCVPEHVFHDGCGPIHDCCPPPKKCCLARLWDCEKRKNRWLMSRVGW